MEFCNEITQPFLKLNLPQNEFHGKSLKTEKNHNKFSSQNIVTSSQNKNENIVQKGHGQVS